MNSCSWVLKIRLPFIEITTAHLPLLNSIEFMYTRLIERGEWARSKSRCSSVCSKSTGSPWMPKIKDAYLRSSIHMLQRRSHDGTIARIYKVEVATWKMGNPPQFESFPASCQRSPSRGWQSGKSHTRKWPRYLSKWGRTRSLKQLASGLLARSSSLSTPSRGRRSPSNSWIEGE